MSHVILNFKMLLPGNITIQQKVLFATVSMVLFPMLFAGIYFYSSTSNILTENATKQLEHMIQQTNDSIETTFDNVNNTSLILMSSPVVSRLLQSTETIVDTPYSTITRRNQITADFESNLRFNYSWEKKILSTVYLFVDESTYYFQTRSSSGLLSVHANNLNIYNRLRSDTSRNTIVIAPSEVDQTIYYIRNQFNITLNKVSAKLIMGMNENILSEKYEEILKYPNAKVFIFDQDGTIISNPDKSILGKKVHNDFLELRNSIGIHNLLIDDAPYYIETKKIQDTGLTLLIGIPRKQVFDKLTNSVNNYIWISFLIVIVCLLISLFVSLRFTNVIKQLMKNIGKIKLGNYDTRMPRYKDFELNQLSNTFNKMAGDIKYLINEVYEKQLLLKETEFKFLQSQMNPHFLFNVLTTISWKAKLNGDDSIHKMVTSLSELLQNSIYSDNKAKIRIREELEFVTFYLYLQKARFEDKIEYTVSIADEDILDCYLPKLCVEPIVENAVVHGLENKIGKGKIMLNIRRDPDSIYLEIIDDGLGFDVNQNAAYGTDTVKMRKNNHTSIGLTNTDKRIKLIYGEQYGIHVHSELGKGSQITVHIPIDREGDVLV